MTHEDILELLAHRNTAFANRDVEGLERQYADNAISESPLGGSAVGRESIAKVIAAFFSAFPDVIYTNEPPLVDGERVAYIATIAGTHIGDFMALPPSGKHFRFSVAFFLDLRNGQIVHERRIYDFTGLLVQIGVLKAKPA